jgi:putative ABC transport system permease protein
MPTTGGPLSALVAVAGTGLVAVLAALLAARRVSRIRPTEALGEVAVEPARAGGRVRLVSGLLALALAGGSGVLTLAVPGTGALAGAVGLLYAFVLAVGLLAPWVNQAAARLLAPVLRGPSGHLAAANLRANARGAATVLTALVLAVGLGGSVWFLQDDIERSTRAQGRAGLVADRVLTAPAGLPAGAVAEVRGLPGVTAATGVRRTSVVVPSFDGVEEVEARAVDPGAAGLDLDVVGGSLADLGPDTVAVSALRGWSLGSRVDLTLADGRRVSPTVVAVYRRGLAFGDVVLDRGTARPDQILVRGTDLDRTLAGRVPGSTVLRPDQVTARVADDLALSAWLNRLFIGVLVGYAALAAANTMVVAALARRRELGQLRLVGVTRRQAARMVRTEQAVLLGVALVLGGTIAALTLTAVVRAVTGDPVPYVPPLGIAAVLLGTTTLALATTIAPVARLLRVPPLTALGPRE